MKAKPDSEWRPVTMTSSSGRYSRSKSPRAYGVWWMMMERCYRKKRLDIQPAYKGCSVCLEWHNFQIFAEWYDENYISDDLHLDKDLMVYGNKVYSPETCLLVFRQINNLFVAKLPAKDDLPLGVCSHEGGYRATAPTINGNRARKIFSSMSDAAAFYWAKKHEYVCAVAKENPKHSFCIQMYFLSFYKEHYRDRGEIT